jgi:2-phosphosulfolactate phosphatase
LFPLQESLVVVTDIFRATTCITVAIAKGADQIFPVSTLEECRNKMKMGCIGAAERGGEKPPEFDLGNSPLEYLDLDLKGKEICITTTNGTITLEKVKSAREVLIGSFLNLSSVYQYLLNSRINNIIIACSGWKGFTSLEDSLFAGALADKLISSGCLPVLDETQLALNLYRSFSPDLYSAIETGDHTRRLIHLGFSEDIRYALSIDLFDVLPVYKNSIIRNFT